MQTHWKQLQRSVATALWTAFLSACLTTGLFFAAFDPQDLLRATNDAVRMSSMSFYSLGFLFFWAMALVATSLNTWLLRTERRRNEFPSL